MKAGSFAGQPIALATGQSIVVERSSARVELGCSHGNLMAGVDLAVECGPSGCCVIDKSSSNGSFLHGARIREAMLADSDESEAGPTISAVHIVPDDQLLTTSPEHRLCKATATSIHPVLHSLRHSVAAILSA